MTKLPKDFSITETHRLYCEKTFGLPYLADTMLSAFKDVFDEEQGGNGKKHKDWNLTFYRFLRQSAPGGQFYKSDYFEIKRQAAKRLEFGDRKRKTPEYHPKELDQLPPTPQASELGLSALRKLRGQLA